MSPSATITDPSGGQDTGSMPKAPEYILERWRRAQTDMAPWHEKIKGYRKMYGFDHYDRAPKAGERRISLPDYTNTVDLAIGILGANPIEFRAFGFSPDVGEQTQGSRVEKFLAGALYINSMRDQIDIEKAHLQQFVRDGAGVIRCLWDDDYHQQFLVKDPNDENLEIFVDLPLRIQWIDVLDFFVVPGGKRRWLATFTRQSRSIEDVEQSEAILLPWATAMKREQRESTMYDWLDYWEYATARDTLLDEEEQPIPETDGYGQPAVDGEGQPVYQGKNRIVVRRATIYNDYLIDPLEIMNGYDDLCSTLTFYEPTPSNDPKTWGKCLISSLKEIVPSLETRFNRQTRLVDLFSSMPLTARTRGGSKTVKMDPGLGKVLQLDLEEELGYPMWPGSPPDVNDQINFLEKKIQETGFPSALYGQGVSQLAGYAIAQLVSTGQIRLTTATSQLQQGWAMVARKCLGLLQQFAGDARVHVYGIYRGQRFQDSVSAADATGIRIDVEVKAQFPGEDVQQTALATQATPHLSHWTILERYYHVPQPDDEMKRRMIDKIRESPAMQEIVVIEYLSELAQAEAAEADPKKPKIYTMLLQRYLTQGTPGQAGRPPEGNRPMQPMGLQGPTGQPAPGAEGAPPFGQEGEAGIRDLVTASPSLTGGGLTG